MKAIAFIFLFIFSFVLAGPAIGSFLKNKEVVCFNLDEQKNNTQSSNSEEAKKELTKDFCHARNYKLPEIKVISIAFVNSILKKSPFIGVITPPPDHC